MVTVTQASPSSDQAILVEKDPTQLLLPPSVSATSDSSTPSTLISIFDHIVPLVLATDSHNTSCESQPLKTRTKKQSRYPCRRAQRPVKQTDTSDQVVINSKIIQLFFYFLF
jgi:hypothetical protein